MNLSELTAYAWEKYHIQEERKWTEFPGFSVLAVPGTGKWAALLMRQWDPEAGIQIERCDIKCGQPGNDIQEKGYVTRPFRMKGEKWVGILMGEETEPEVVFWLFDRAVSLYGQDGSLIFLEDGAERQTKRKADGVQALENNPDIFKGSMIPTGALQSRKRPPRREDTKRAETRRHQGSLYRSDEPARNGQREKETDRFVYGENEAGRYVNGKNEAGRLGHGENEECRLGHGENEASRYVNGENESGRYIRGEIEIRSGEEKGPGVYTETRLSFDRVPCFTDTVVRQRSREPEAGSGGPVRQDGMTAPDSITAQNSMKAPGSAAVQSGMAFQRGSERQGGMADLGNTAGRYSLADRDGGHRVRFEVPARILEMQKLYTFGDGSYTQKCRSFYQQGKYMEDYEDNVLWFGEFRHYFPTYHDLNIRQLRGYFTWRAQVRRGIYRPVPVSLAYLYLYELLCGIGADSPEEALDKMKAFEEGFLKSGMGDAGLQKNLRRWRLEYAVLKGLPAEMARRFADPEVLARDQALIVLKKPGEHTEEEIFSALSFFGGNKLEQSPVIVKYEDRGKRMFSAAWRAACAGYKTENGTYKKDWFTTCFGEQRMFPWHPLANAIFWEEPPAGRQPEERTDEEVSEKDYILNECRRYRRLENGSWREMRYEMLYFDKDRFQGFLHAADCGFRRYLRTSHYLREKPDEAWAAPYVEAAIRADQKTQEEAARPKITIDFSGLERIRRDAGLTREALLTEEETADRNSGNYGQEELRRKEAGTMGDSAAETGKTGSIEGSAAETRKHEDVPEGILFKVSKQNKDMPAEGGMIRTALDPVHQEVLRLLLAGQDPLPFLRSKYLMPSVVADAINEAFFDEIGDSVLECEGDAIRIVEDYRGELERTGSVF